MKAVHVFVFNTFADWEPSYALPRINSPEFQKEPGRYTVKTVGLTLEPVTSMGGLRVLPDMTLDKVRPQDSAMLLLPGGIGWERGNNPEAIRLAKEFLKADVPVAAICGATAGLALAGVLDDRAHTSNALQYLQMVGYKGEAYYRDEPAVLDKNVITAGAMGAVDFAYQIFRRLDLFPEEALEAWYALFKKGDPKPFYRLMVASGTGF